MGRVTEAGGMEYNGAASMQQSGDDGELDAEGVSRNRRHRTMRQQMLNKQAQQRYRCALEP